MHTNFVVQFDGYAGPTVRFAATTNNAYGLDDVTNLELTDSAGGTAIGILITVETYGVRMAFGGTAPTTAVGHLRSDGESIQIGGKNSMDSLEMINAVNGENFIIQVTPFFSKPLA